ncbi:unnamed protein product [Didymodactylos carnosus]|uniref:Thioredoxin-like fold domain-containing protein n=1 Tax=Didymodactylos carnosus TaxID=1234261 RepID=A0A814G9I4_9BILA|nr:unnamed protein product [Didymodactylos carnosus]CAF0993268.1 unnamed protein product [Didymodactylos carnosus]CAF3683304.1 unnamed protein product [Didymodactylos carnosus]CAF3765069.1 unnamed protein product [Didymodactylos carnosus]
MANVASIVGPNIVDKSGQKVDLNSQQFAGKVIGLYFSGHWYFTPVLAEFYTKYSESKKLEIIFVSSDRDEKSYQEYYNGMPWLSLEYKDREKKDELSKRFFITGIPALILVDGDSGETICEDARMKLHSDPNGENFPWKTKKPSSESSCLLH